MKKVKKLNNEIRLISKKIDYVESINVGIFIKAGPLLEDREINGISHLLEHMLFKGTGNRNAKEIGLEMDRLGGDLNAYTSFDYTCLSLRILNNYIYDGLNIVLDMLNNFDFNIDELESEKQVIFDEIIGYEDDPEELATNELYKILYGNDSYRYSILGTKENLENMDIYDLFKYKSEKYTSSNIVISVVGNFDEEELYNYFNNYNDYSIKVSNEKTVINKIVMDNKVDIKKYINKEFEQLTGYINLFNKIDYKKFKYETILLDSILGSSVSSRLFQYVREELGLSYNIESFIIANEREGSLNISFTTNIDNLINLRKSIAEVLNKLKNNDIKEDELEIAKNQIVSEYKLNLEDPFEEMIINGEKLLFDNSVFDLEIEISKIKDVSIDSLNKFRKSIFNKFEYNEIYVGNINKEMRNYIKSNSISNEILS